MFNATETVSCAADVSLRTTGEGPTVEPMMPCGPPHAESAINAIPVTAAEHQPIATVSYRKIRLVDQTPDRPKGNFEIVISRNRRWRNSRLGFR
jgi:hypothetical protein